MAQGPPQQPARQGGTAAGPLSADTEEVLSRQRNMQVHDAEASTRVPTAVWCFSLPSLQSGGAWERRIP